MEKLLIIFLFLIVVLLSVIALFLRKVIKKIIENDLVEIKKRQNYLKSRDKEHCCPTITEKVLLKIKWAELRMYLF